MPAFDFPNAPSVGQTANGYTWDGKAWVPLALSPIMASIGTIGPTLQASDLLVGVSPGVMARLPVGTTGQILAADNSVPPKAVWTSVIRASFNVQPPSGSAVINLVKPASGTSAAIFGYNGANFRWAMYLGNPTAEGGSNAGSDVQLSRFNDAGGFIDSPLMVMRATGIAQFSQPVLTPGIQYAIGAGGIIALDWTAPFLRAWSGGALIQQGTLPYGLNGFTQIYGFGLNGGNATITGGYSGGVFSWNIVFSDRRLKTNIKKAAIDALGLLNKLVVHSCDFKAPFKDSVTEHLDCALIADEVQELIPAAYIPPPPPPEAEPDAVTYATVRELPLIATLIKAVQQLTAKVEDLEAKLEAIG
jgi:hypothetical protein